MITDIINIFTKMEEEKMTRYESAKEIYAKLGVDTDAAITKCKEIPVSLHCWQGVEAAVRLYIVRHWSSV